MTDETANRLWLAFLGLAVLAMLWHPVLAAPLERVLGAVAAGR